MDWGDVTVIKAEDLKSLITSNYELVTSKVVKLKKKQDMGRKKRPLAVSDSF